MFFNTKGTTKKFFHIGGPSGPALHSGVGTPLVELGINGDLFLSQDLNNLFIKRTGSWEDMTFGGVVALNDLTDVTIDTPASGNIITFDGTNFVNSDSSVAQIARQILSGSINAISGTGILTIEQTPNATTGTEIWSQTITTIDGSTRIRVNMSALVDVSHNNRYITFILLRDSVVISAQAISIAGPGNVGTFTMAEINELPTTASATYIYSVRVAVSSQTWFVGQDHDGFNFNGANGSSYSIMEIL